MNSAAIATEPTVTWPLGATFKEMVSICLTALSARGRTHAQIGMLFDSAPSARETALAAMRAALAKAAAGSGVSTGSPPATLAPVSALRVRTKKILKGNVITMHMNPENAVVPLAFDRIPDLARAVNLTPLQCLKIFRQRTIDHPDSASALSTRTLDWCMGNAFAAKNEIAEAKVKSKVGS